MTTMPARHDLRLSYAEASPPPGHWEFTPNETCSILTGWKRRDAVLRQLSRTHAVIGGIIGLRRRRLPSPGALSRPDHRS